MVRKKTLAAFIAWLALCIASEMCGVDMADFQHPAVQALVASLLRLDSVLKSSVSEGDEIDSAISRIVKQNVDARVQPVSSLTWASVLASLGWHFLGASCQQIQRTPRSSSFRSFWWWNWRDHFKRPKAPGWTMFSMWK